MDGGLDECGGWARGAKGGGWEEVVEESHLEVFA
jgi:hypothetical protein